MPAPAIVEAPGDPAFAFRRCIDCPRRPAAAESPRLLDRNVRFILP
jgi:hypothetical protein